MRIGGINCRPRIRSIKVTAYDNFTHPDFQMSCGPFVPCCGSAGMFAFQVGIHDAAPREELLEVSIPWNRTSAVASQNLGKFSPMIAMITPERQLEEQLIQA